MTIKHPISFSIELGNATDRGEDRQRRWLSYGCATIILHCRRSSVTVTPSSSFVNLLLFSPSLTPSVHPLSTTVLLWRRRFSCRAASPGPPPAPRTDPPPGNDSGMLHF
ncbi:hypothetical protein Ahy_A01g004902 isoform I [Arachis hypogaea]|uniref:Uncharacterized protein n=1 Tax=Arachis hypogaea TaxID=3818 RepID=A0A445EXH7_ARAHY|nr:hypothetical protein Ahy_A01g004902 isoform I [Arachis hypogaea]